MVTWDKDKGQTSARDAIFSSSSRPVFMAQERTKPVLYFLSHVLAHPQHTGEMSRQGLTRGKSRFGEARL